MIKVPILRRISICSF